MCDYLGINRDCKRIKWKRGQGSVPFLLYNKAGQFGAALKTAAHGVVGGASAKLNGGNFSNGFWSAGVTQGFSKAIDGLKYSAVAAAAVGGTSSVLGGGKFANGAWTGAFSRVFNDEKVKYNSGERRRAARRAAAARGSTTMPELAEGRYLAVIDSISGEFLVDVGMGDLWIVDSDNNRHLHFGFVGIGGGVTLGGSVSKQFGALYVSSTSNVEGFSFQLEIDGTSGVGGKSTTQLLNEAVDPVSSFGGIAVGLDVGISGVVNYTWFKKVYDADDSPLIFP